jgi:hypothetical protein
MQLLEGKGREGGICLSVLCALLIPFPGKYIYFRFPFQRIVNKHKAMTVDTSRSSGRP